MLLHFSSILRLKDVNNISIFCRSIGNELDDQAVMLDDMGTEMENTQNRMDSMLKKIAKVTHLSNGKLCAQLILLKFSTRSNFDIKGLLH